MACMRYRSVQLWWNQIFAKVRVKNQIQGFRADQDGTGDSHAYRGDRFLSCNIQKPGAESYGARIPRGAQTGKDAPPGD